MFQLGFPIVIIVGVVLTVISPIVSVIPCVKSSSQATMCQSGNSTLVSEGDHTLGFSKAKGVTVGTVVVGVVVSLAVETVLAYGAIPDSVVRVKLFAESTSVGEWKGSSGMTSLRIIVMILQHGIPL